jgi:hypothetical protein
MAIVRIGAGTRVPRDVPRCQARDPQRSICCDKPRGHEGNHGYTLYTIERIPVDFVEWPQ